MSANFSNSYISSVNNVTTTFADRQALSLIDLKKNIITAFHASRKFAPNALQQSTNSFAARFPASGKMGDPSYHVPGTRLLGTDTRPAAAYRDITLDDRLVLNLFVDEEDERVRAVIPFQDMFGEEMGQSIANFDDINTAIIAILAARASATVTGYDGGTVVSKAGADSNVGALNAAIWDMKNTMDEKNVPQSSRWLGLRPAQFNLMASSFDRMFHRDLGQAGSIGASVSLPSYAGFQEIFMTNNLPSTNIASSPTGTRNTYAGDFTKTVGVAFQKGAFGTVVPQGSLPMGGGSQPKPLMDGQTDARMSPVDVREVKIDEAYGTLYLASLITGHGILNPVRAGEIVIP
jgi:hypothetical protein